MGCLLEIFNLPRMRTPPVSFCTGAHKFCSWPSSQLSHWMGQTQPCPYPTQPCPYPGLGGSSVKWVYAQVPGWSGGEGNRD